MQESAGGLARLNLNLQNQISKILPEREEIVIENHKNGAVNYFVEFNT